MKNLIINFFMHGYSPYIFSAYSLVFVTIVLNFLTTLRYGKYIRKRLKRGIVNS